MWEEAKAKMLFVLCSAVVPRVWCAALVFSRRRLGILPRSEVDFMLFGQ